MPGGDLVGHVLHLGDVADRGIVDLREHVAGHDGRFGVVRGPARTDRGDDHAVAALEFQFAGGERRNIAGGDAPLFQFKLLALVLFALGGGELERFLLAIALHDHFDLLADGQIRHHLVQERDFLGVADEHVPAGDFQEDVARMHARFGGGRIIHDVRDQHAVVVLVFLEQRLDFDAEPTAADLAFVDDLAGDALGEVAGDGAAEAEADFVDADDLAFEVDERAARVAGINVGVVADPADERADVFAVEGEPRGGERFRHDHFDVADDAEGDGLRHGQRATHGQDRIADAHRVRVAKVDGGEFAFGVGLQFQDGDVGERVGTDEVGGDFLVTGEDDDEAGGVSGDVVIGDDVAFLADDDAAAAAFELHLAALIILRGDNLDADQRGFDAGDRLVDLAADGVDGVDGVGGVEPMCEGGSEKGERDGAREKPFR